MKELKANYPIEVKWRSFLLRPAGGQPISATKMAQIMAHRNQFKDKIFREYGLEINQGPFEVDTYPAHVLSKYAETYGLGEEYQQAVQAAYWLKGQKLDDLPVLKAIMEDIGLDSTNLPQILETHEYKARALDDLREAAFNSISAVPALVFDERYLVVGAQPYQYLSQVADKVLQEKAGETAEK